MKKRLSALLLALLLLLQGLCVPALAVDHNSTARAAAVNEAAAVLRQGMTQCQPEIYVVCRTEDDDGSLAGEIVAAAMAHTGKPNEGDYLYWNCVKWPEAKKTYHSSTETEILYQVRYYTTPEQEKELDRAIKAQLRELGLYGKDTYTKVRGVYQWIYSSVEYDDFRSDFSHSAYSAMMRRTAVCSGYAVLFYRMMLELGVDCRVIAGMAGERHGWNLVQMDDGYYYYVDATWESNLNVNGTEQYFLKNKLERHVPDAQYQTAEFRACYPLGRSSYDPQWLQKGMSRAAAVPAGEAVQLKPTAAAVVNAAAPAAAKSFSVAVESSLDASALGGGRTVLAGRVKRADGTPAANVEVRVMQKGSPLKAVYTDAAGCFEIEVLKKDYVLCFEDKYEYAVKAPQTGLRVTLP